MKNKKIKLVYKYKGLKIPLTRFEIKLKFSDTKIFPPGYKAWGIELRKLNTM